MKKMVYCIDYMKYKILCLEMFVEPDLEFLCKVNLIFGNFLRKLPDISFNV
jgi:hypothetical protein